MSRETFPGLSFKLNQGQMAIELLEHAIETLKAGEPHESALDKGTRIKSATVIGVAALAELQTLAGYCEAAHAAELGGLIESEDDDG